jgi:membrane-associated phospholipid phosphatase
MTRSRTPDPPPLIAPPLIATSRRVAAGAIVAVAVAVLTLLGLRYRDGHAAGRFDRAVDGWFTGHVNYRTALWFADLGNGPVVLLLVVLAAAGCLWLRRVRGALLVALAPAVAAAVTEWLVKPLVHRTKDGWLAYPSGHTSGFGALVLAVLLVLLGQRVSSLAVRVTVAVIASLLLLACMLGLIASDYHYATDVVGGFCVAVACVVVVALAVDAAGTRSSARRPPAWFD